MRVPYLWLKDYLHDLNVTPEEVARRLTLAGVEAETVDDFNPGIRGVVAGVIENIKAFPGKDNLTILSVNAGEHSSRQIVCGAPNVRIGQRVFLALPGSTLPGDRQIEEIEFQGVISEGMLCSAKELGLDLVQEDDGILTMDEYVPAGTDMVEYLEIDDKIIVLDLTPNRADCLGLIGVACELAALLEDRLRIPPGCPFESDEKIEDVVSVEIEDEIFCPRYTARVIRDIKIKPSPLWLQVRLLKAGIRPISNIVDVTNYVMWEYGQPLHAFDYQLVDSGTIIVRRAEEGESLITIDGVERSLNTDKLVIADSGKPIAVAGVMGGKNTEISLQTEDVLLEAAYFDPITTRRMARNLGLISEASLRFEKGVNPERIVDALDRAAGMISELADGKVIGGIADCYPRTFVQDVVEISPERVEHILGTGIPAERMVGILERLGFTVKMPDIDKRWMVTVPFGRADVKIEEDIVEEIARHFGYGNIPAKMPEGKLMAGRETPENRIIHIIQDTMLGCGFYEAITYSFMSAGNFDKLRLVAEDPWRRCIRISNPITEEQGVMRTTLIPGLLEVLKYNCDHKEKSSFFFEIGSVFYADELPLKDLPREEPVLAVMGTGKISEKSWNTPDEEIDFFFIKGAIETIFARLGVGEFSFVKSKLPFLQPGRAADILIGGTKAGILGILHPDTGRNFGLKQDVALAEIYLEPLISRAKLFKTFKSLPRYPASLRDLAVVVPGGVTAREVEECIRETGESIVESVVLFDVYEGAPIPSGQRSLAYSIVYRSRERTLTDEDVSTIHTRIEKELGKRLRVYSRE